MLVLMKYGLQARVLGRSRIIFWHVLLLEWLRLPGVLPKRVHRDGLVVGLKDLRGIAALVTRCLADTLLPPAQHLPRPPLILVRGEEQARRAHSYPGMFDS